jgi:GTP-binding protein YchF
MAKLSIGIIGLPNAGKSTLFQALTSIAVPAESYPFCTIEPNLGVVPVPDERLGRLAELVDAAKVTPAVVEFVDIAGLVEGASHGEGLGNRFLQHIREVDAIAHVVRLFSDDTVARVSEGDAARDLELVETELALADLELVEAHAERVTRKARSGEREARDSIDLIRRVLGRLERGQPVRREFLSENERRLLSGLNLLTLKPQMYVPNVGEDFWIEPQADFETLRAALLEKDPDAMLLPVSARLEAELAELSPAERSEYLEAIGAEGAGLARLIRAGYGLLQLITFFSFNENELRAWTIREGTLAPQAAGTVHTDFEKHFIRAETIGFEEFERHGSLKSARDAGALRFEGKDYIVRDGDVLWFRTGA